MAAKNIHVARFNAWQKGNMAENQCELTPTNEKKKKYNKNKNKNKNKQEVSLLQGQLNRKFEPVSYAYSLEWVRRKRAVNKISIL